MKVIIDLIEDIRASINNEASFSLRAVGLKEDEKSQFTPLWQSDINQYKVDDKTKKLYLFLGREAAVSIGELLETLNALANEKMMYEVCISYAKEEQRIDAPLLGFGESLEEKKYLLFIAEA